ncbi:MAG: hypothetical protein FJ102_10680 [Deltaproteobacteria bacterium]|nr:hypothetical protein [Deltaproteobacteria bacterium]
MLVLLLSLALADNHTTTFAIDPQYTDPPFAGLERLYVDPAQSAAQIKPVASRPAVEGVKDVPGKGQLVYTNPMSQWGEVTVNGLKIGTIGPFATMTLDGIAPGWYQVDVWVATGLTRRFAVEVVAP